MCLNFSYTHLSYLYSISFARVHFDNFSAKWDEVYTDDDIRKGEFHGIS